MKEVNDIVNELRELQSPLADMPRTMPYAVPEGYFALLEESIKTGISGATDYRLAIQDKATPYEVPERYFATLPQNILAAIHTGSSREMPYAAPEGYFDQLPLQMLEAAKADGNRKKTIQLGGTIWKNIRWAAAAAIIIGIGFGSYKMLQPAEPVSTEAQLAKIPGSTINDYIQANIDDFDADMLATNINSTTPTAAQLPEDEIVNYLNETGWDETTIN